MKLQFDGVKHTLGYFSVGALPFVPTVVFAFDHAANAKYVAGACTVVLGLVAFLCGAQSKEVFASEVASTATALGVNLPPIADEKKE